MGTSFLCLSRFEITMRLKKKDNLPACCQTQTQTVKPLGVDISFEVQRSELKSLHIDEAEVRKRSIFR